jgi:small-conductance mechanosensitive channel
VSELFTIPGDIRQILAAVNRIEQKVDTLMSEDATVEGIATDLQADATTILNALAALVAALNGEGNTLSPAALQALQSAQSAVDAAAAKATGDVPPAPAPPAS